MAHVREVLSSTRRPSAKWSRLKPPPTDPLETIDPKTQETYYQKIVERYMQFCAAAGRDDDTLDRVFASLSVHEKAEHGSVPVAIGNNSSVTSSSTAVGGSGMEPSTQELAVLLMAMRKLREGLIASGRNDNFSQRAYVFIIRAAVLTSSWESYQPAIFRLLQQIHPVTPLPAPELREFVGYHVLDVACRRGEYGEAFAVRNRWGLKNDMVDGVLRALVHEDWTLFWQLRGTVDGYQRRLMEWAEDGMRKHALKCLGRSYLSVERSYVERCAGRGWDELKAKDGIGWELDGDKVTIRRIRAK